MCPPQVQPPTISLQMNQVNEHNLSYGKMTEEQSNVTATTSTILMGVAVDQLLLVGPSTTATTIINNTTAEGGEFFHPGTTVVDLRKIPDKLTGALPATYTATWNDPIDRRNGGHSPTGL